MITVPKDKTLVCGDFAVPGNKGDVRLYPTYITTNSYLLFTKRFERIGKHVIIGDPLFGGRPWSFNLRQIFYEKLKLTSYKNL